MSQEKRFSRRGFLKCSAALGTSYATPLILPRKVLGQNNGPAPSERITVGMIGVGRQAVAYNIPQFLKMPEVQIVAVSDVDSWRMNNAKRQVEQSYAQQKPSGSYRFCTACGDFHDILERKDIDAVMISTPDHWHVPIALEALKAGKDVSLEKPICRTIAEGRTLADMVATQKRVFRVDSEFRSYRHIRFAAELIRNGRIGKVRNITVGVPADEVTCPPQPDMPVPKELDYERWQGPAPRATYTERRVHKPKSYARPGWMRHLYYCDGMITNWTTHWNDGAAWCADLERTGPVEIAATGTYPPRQSFWNNLLKFEVKMRFANGINWTYHTAKDAYFKIEGDKGWIYAEYKMLKVHPTSIWADWNTENDHHSFRMKSDKQDFIDCVKTRTETLEPAEVGHRVTSLGLLGQIAIQMGEKLQWDPDIERFVGNDAANEFLDKPIHAPRYL